MRILAPPFLALAFLAGCDGNSTGSGQAASPEATDTPAPVPSGSPVPVITTIPAALQGRWGLVAADCEPGRSDAKGLLTIDAATLKFYESVGKLDRIEEASDMHIRGTFTFMGEGMAWRREVLLELREGGDLLVRRDYGDDAPAGPFRYSRCP